MTWKKPHKKIIPPPHPLLSQNSGSGWCLDFRCLTWLWFLCTGASNCRILSSGASRFGSWRSYGCSLCRGYNCEGSSHSNTEKDQSTTVTRSWKKKNETLLVEIGFCCIFFVCLEGGAGNIVAFFCGGFWSFDWMKLVFFFGGMTNHWVKPQRAAFGG